MTEKDKAILEFVKIAEDRCRKMAFRYHIEKDDIEDWISNATVQICRIADRIMALDNKQKKEAYICAICRTARPRKNPYECPVPVDDDGEELDDLVFVDDRNAESALTAEPEKQTTLEMYKNCKRIIKKLGGSNSVNFNLSLFLYNHKTAGRQKGVKPWNLIKQC